jgi:hypothetical protein
MGEGAIQDFDRCGAGWDTVQVRYALQSMSDEASIICVIIRQENGLKGGTHSRYHTRKFFMRNAVNPCTQIGG